jgi:hypothetical protein
LFTKKEKAMHLPGKVLIITGAAALMLGGGTAALAVIHPSATPASTGSPSDVISMTQYQPSGALEVTGGSWAFLGSPPEEHFLSQHTAAEVTATVSEGTVEGGTTSGVIGICYEHSGGSTVTDVSQVAYTYPDVGAPVYALPQTVSGVVGNLPAGEYFVGLCAESQGYTSNESAAVTMVLTVTRAGVTYRGL